MPLDTNTLHMLEERFDVVWVDGNEEEIHVTCPYCEKRGHTPDRSGHLAINLGKDMAHCVRCDWGTRGAADWLRKRGLPILGSLAGARKTLLGLTDALKGVAREIPLRTQSLALPTAFDYFGDGDDDLPFMGHYLGSMKRKNINLPDLVRHRVGYCSDGFNEGYVIFPFWQGPDLVYWQGRAALPSLLADPKKKKLNPSKTKVELGKGHWFYGYGDAVKGGKVALVEGPLDRITVHDFMRRTYGEDSCALSVQGHTVSFPGAGDHPLNSQIGQLLALEPSEVVVLFDPDVQEASQALAQLLQVAGLNAHPGFLPYGDPNDFHNNDRVLARATSVLDWSDIALERLNNTKL